MKMSEVGKAILEQIRRGGWKTGQRIPSERQIAGEMRVSRFPVRTAIAQLVKMGVLEQRHGSGTFLTKMPDSAIEQSLRDHFETSARQQGREKFHARRVVVQRRYRIGFHHGMASNNPVALSLLGGIMAYAQHREHDITAKSAPEQITPRERFQNALPDLISSSADGLIISFTMPLEILPLLKKISIPAIFLCHNPNLATEFNSISIDVAGACQQALQKLADQGHRRIAILEKAYTAPAAKLLHVGANLCKEQKLDQALHFFGNDPVSELWPRIKNVTALYVMDDVYCAQVCRQLAEKGVKIGRDLAVACQSNKGIERGLPPEVERMEFDIAGWGHLAAHMLEYRLDENLPSLPPIKLGACHRPASSKR
ncbi:MAG: GntR family transcriptional regulator [Verrucomicrobiae bacterium]|nr:GntR family transcriptional regulator [Verrucomicrobiae bacterium]